MHLSMIEMIKVMVAFISKTKNKTNTQTNKNTCLHYMDYSPNFPCPCNACRHSSTLGFPEPPRKKKKKKKKKKKRTNKKEQKYRNKLDHIQDMKIIMSTNITIRHRKKKINIQQIKIKK